MANLRDDIMDHLRLHPGASTTAVATAFNVDPSTADYHLKRLRRASRALDEMAGRAACWYPANGYCPVLRKAIPLLARPDAQRIAACVGGTPRSAAFLARATGVRPGAVRWIANAMEEAGLVDRSRLGRLTLARGADVCLARASAKARCDEWGRCPVSRALMKQAVGAGALSDESG